MVVCQQTGCVQYTQRFFSEVLKDPATASPLLFPETVFAAPASHVAALLEDTPMLYTVIGDPAAFLSGLWLGVGWLQAGLVDVCLIVGTEEANWVLAEALWLFEHATTISSGAGAVCLCAEAALSLGVELNLITQAQTFSQPKDRARAAQAMRDQFPPFGPKELLCDGRGASYRTNAAEQSAWRDWTGPRLSPKRILGEGLMAAAAWQCVAACDAVASGEFSAANVSLVGCNQQAIGARFMRVVEPAAHA
jgi:3-oxoacyl-(acyl-carrier-protein) synthase